MICPKCGSENNDSAKFCKKCGTQLKSSNVEVKESKNNTAKIIIVALIIVVVALAGALIYLNGFANNQSSESTVENESVENETPTQVEPTQSTQEEVTPTSMAILGGIFNTGSKLSDKTKASIYVGEDHAGEKVKIQIYYSRDGNSLNNGNMVSKTVDSDGYINVNSANAFKYYPDYATINLYDNSGNIMDSTSVSLNPSSGTQSF